MNKYSNVTRTELLQELIRYALLLEVMAEESGDLREEARIMIKADLIRETARRFESCECFHASQSP